MLGVRLLHKTKGGVMNMLKLVIIMVAIIVAPAQAADGTKVGGFVDVQYQWNKAGTAAGFALSDAAVYLNSDMGMCSATMDLPIAMNFSTAAVAFGAGKAQAFVHHKYSNGVNWRLGQFDSLFGLEANDTKDNAMASLGIVKTNITPFVHAGTTVGYDAGNFKVNLILAKQQAAAANADSQYGAHVNGAFGDLSVGAGVLLGKRSGESTNLIDAVLNYKAGKVGFGAEFVMKKDPSVGTDTALGIAALMGFGMTDTMGLDARFGYVSKAITGNSSTIEISAGPSFNMSKAMTCKVHYTFTSATPTTGEGTTSHAAAIASVYTF